MESDLADFREHNGETLSYQIGDDSPLKKDRLAGLRLFYTVNRGSSEAVGYIDEEKIIAFVVMSSKSRKGLEQSLPVLRTVLRSYAFMHMHFVDGAQEKEN